MGERLSDAAVFLLDYGWTKVEGTWKYWSAPIYWRDPDPMSLEPMVPQEQAVAIQKARIKSDPTLKCNFGGNHGARNCKCDPHEVQ